MAQCRHASYVGVAKVLLHGALSAVLDPSEALPAALRKASRPDYLYLLQRLCMDNPEGAVNLAKTVAKQPGPPIDLNTMADMFLQRNMVREATAFLLEVLQDNDPQHDKLQTKVSEPPIRQRPGCPGCCAVR